MITYNMPGVIYEDEAMAKAWDILKTRTVVVVDGSEARFLSPG